MLDATLVSVLDAIAESGVEVKYEEPAKGEPGSVELHSFQTDVDAHLWLASREFGEKDVAAGFSSALLRDALLLQGRACCANRESGIGRSMQVFLMGVSLFGSPVDAHLLYAYLNLPHTPIDEYCVKDSGGKLVRLRWLMRSELLEKGGLANGWQDREVFKKDGSAVRGAKSVGDLWGVGQWLKTKNGLVLKSEVKTFLEKMGKWASKRAGMSKEADDALQMCAVASACETLIAFLSLEGKKVSVERLVQLAGKAVSPVTLGAGCAEVGSLNVVGSLTNCCDSPHDAYVFGSVDDSGRYPYAFLSQKEANLVRENGALFWTSEEFSEVQNKAQSVAAGRVTGTLHMVESKVVKGALATESALLTEMKSRSVGVNRVSDEEVEGLETCDVHKIEHKQLEHNVQEGLLVGRRAKESYTSLEKLIQNPFDYVVEYMKGWKGYGAEDLSDLKIVKGTVAHAYVEQLTNDCGRDLGKMIDEHEKNMDSRLDVVLQEKGLLMLESENRLELMSFKKDLKESVSKLLEVIKNNDWKIVGPEQEIEAEIGEIGKIWASVDYLLTDKNGDWMILDFKWSDGHKRYETKVSEGKALQLLVYEKVLLAAQRGKVSTKAYYLFPLKRFFTVDSIVDVKPVEKAEGYVSDAARWVQFENSVKYRREQLANGVIEEGGGMPVADLQYEKDRAEKNLYPLDEYPKDAKSGTFGNNAILKGDLE